MFVTKTLGWVMLAFGATVVCAKDLYVAPGGSDAVTYATNSLATPWATPAKAWAEAKAGDTVYFRGGTYLIGSEINTQSIGNDGTAAAPIVFTSYPGEKAVFNCQGVVTALSIQKNYNIIRDLHFQNHAIAIQIGYNTGGDYTTVERCTAQALWVSTADNYGFVCSRSRTAHILVQNNRVVGPGSSIVFNYAGVILFGTRNAKVLNNEFKALPRAIFYKHPNILSAQSETDIEFAYNYFEDCYNAITSTACFAYIHDNISGINGGGMTFGLDSGIPDGASIADYCVIEHNTIYSPKKLEYSSPGIVFEYYERGFDTSGNPIDPLRGCTNNTLVGNLMMSNHRCHAYGPPRDKNGNYIVNYNYSNIYDYNMYHSRVYVSGDSHPSNYALAIQDGVDYPTLATWRAKIGGDQHSLAANPIFLGGESPSTIAGFALAPGSPGKGVGPNGSDMGANVSRVGIQDLGSLTITGPNGGETWRRGETRAITWTAQGISESLVLELMQGPTLLGVIATGIVPGAETYSWTVGRLANGAFHTGANLKVRIRTSSGQVQAEARVGTK